MTVNDAIALFNLPEGVIQLAIVLTWVWVIALVVIGFIVRVIDAVTSI